MVFMSTQRERFQAAWMQQPAVVPVELVKEWQHEAWMRVTGDLEQLIFIAERAAAYGREQAQQLT
jgi:hypothetical protein